MSDDRIKEKIRKLFAIANDGRGNEHEAATALRQANALMQKHGMTNTPTPVKAQPKRTPWIDLVYADCCHYIGDRELAWKVAAMIVSAIQAARADDMQGSSVYEKQVYSMQAALAVQLRLRHTAFVSDSLSKCATLFNRSAATEEFFAVSFTPAVKGTIAGHRITIPKELKP